jgi:hypothetical protein
LLEDNSWPSHMAVAALLMCVVRGLLHGSSVEQMIVMHHRYHHNYDGVMSTIYNARHVCVPNIFQDSAEGGLTVKACPCSTGYAGNWCAFWTSNLHRGFLGCVCTTPVQLSVFRFSGNFLPKLRIMAGNRKFSDQTALDGMCT